MKKDINIFIANIIKTISIYAILITVVSNNCIPVCASQTKENVVVYVDGEQYVVRALNHEFDNNMYLSMKDMSIALSKTEKAYELEWIERDGDTVAALVPSLEGLPVENQDIERFDEEDEKVNHSRRKTYIEIDGNVYCFYAITVKEENANDCYVNLGEFALAMNVDVECRNNAVYINPRNEFDFDKFDLDDTGIAFMADSCIVADATTGEIYYSMNEDEVVAIASTSKLMTYLIIAEAIEDGRISPLDTVTFSNEASKLSMTSNGVIRVNEGKTASLEDVIKGMLIVSSNECSLALAQHLCGSEEAFVELMNKKAQQLGMSEEARFYNPHGLPVYLDDALTIKQSNHLTASDMLILSSYILNNYPQITDITSIKKTRLASFNDFKAENTNMLLYNVPGTVGLKTGTTDKAASCLVSAYKAKDASNNEHNIVTIVYGAENSQTQGYVSMLLMRYGIQCFNDFELGILPKSEDERPIPATLEGLIKEVLRVARQNAK